MDFNSAYEQLNDEQKEAVDTIDGPLMVLAGPGTGKTQIIAMRIARILQKTGLYPHNILCLTFTESGATAMRKRLIQIIGQDAYYVHICTFHSFCNEIILDHPEKFFFVREMALLHEVERVKIIRDILDSLEAGTPLKLFASSYMYEKAIGQSISDLKREDITAENFEKSIFEIEKVLNGKGDLIEDFVGINGNALKESDVINIQKELSDTFFARLFVGFDISIKTERTALKKLIEKTYNGAKDELPKQKELLHIYNEYQRILREKSRYDYEDMILFVVNLLKKSDRILAKLQEQFQYVLVDEYQDTNGAQNEVIKLIGEFFENPNIFVVGDDKQSIYRFQGASIENILYFKNLYKNHAKIIALKNNYRSNQEILIGATNLIKHNEQGVHTIMPELDQKLIAKANIEPQKIRFAEFNLQSTEIQFLATQIKELLEDGIDPKEIAIIYRNNKDSEPIKELFLRLKIPFRVMSGMNILNDKDIINLIGFLRFLVDGTDDHNLFFILNYDFLGFNPIDVIKLVRNAHKNRETLFECAIKDEKFKSFLEKCATWTKESINKTLAEFFDQLINESGYLNHLLNSQNKVEKLNKLNTFFDQLKEMNSGNPLLTLGEFVEYMDLLRENGTEIVAKEFSVQKEAITLMTAHKSKGLEFEYAFITGARDKHWGNQKAQNRIKLPQVLLKTELIGKKEKNEEERRLFYVALTRAKKVATISYSKLDGNGNGMGKEALPSIFVENIGRDFMENVDTSKYEDDFEQEIENSFVPIVKNYKEEEEEFIKELLENYSLNVTHLNTFLHCPRQFYFSELLKVPRAKTKSSSFGTAVHKALEDLLANQEGEIKSKEYLLESFKKHLKRETLTKKRF